MRAAPAYLLAITSTTVVLAAGTAPAAQAREGQITGQITNSHGAPLSGISAAAVPVGGDSVLQTTSDSTGRYTLDLPPGIYDVGFNTTIFGPVDANYDPAIYGGPGPGPSDDCTVCDGTAVRVTAGSVAGNVNGSLAPAAFTLNDFVRPLSGKTIGVVNGKLDFKVGCHEYPNGCSGRAYLRIGTTITAPPAAETTIAIRANGVESCISRSQPQSRDVCARPVPMGCGHSSSWSRRRAVH